MQSLPAGHIPTACCHTQHCPTAPPPPAQRCPDLQEGVKLALVPHQVCQVADEAEPLLIGSLIVRVVRVDTWQGRKETAQRKSSLVLQSERCAQIHRRHPCATQPPTTKQPGSQQPSPPDLAQSPPAVCSVGAPPQSCPCAGAAEPGPSQPPGRCRLNLAWRRSVWSP